MTTTVTLRRDVVTRLATRDAFIEDVQWFVDTGECWSQAVVRLGYPRRPDSLERRLERAGRQDLITMLRSREISDLDRPWIVNTHSHTRTTNGRPTP